MELQPTLIPRRPVFYDATRRRLWLFGQRCHHGAAGALVAAGACGALATVKMARLSAVGLMATGSLLMAHDWHDRAIWFERGAGTQP